MALSGPVVAAAEQPALPAPANQQSVAPAGAAPAPTAAVAPVGSTPIEPTLGPTAVPWPADGPPSWVRTLTSTTLWDGSDAGAAPKSTFAANGYLKTLGPIVGTRLPVYSTGDGGSTGPGWVDKDAVQPSDLPPWLGGPAPPGVTANLATPPVRNSDADPAPTVTATHVAVIDDASGKLLYGLDEHAQVPEASVTKIATTIVALERQPDLTQTYTTSISATEMANRDGSSVMGLEPGEQVTLATLLNGMMLPSGNDAAEQVALSIGGDRQTFVGWMNQEAAALGLKDTHFQNPSGMDEDGHYSSASDMAMLARYAMRNDTFRSLAGTLSYTGDGFGPMHNLNRLLGVYKGTDGVKIGYTDNAHKTFVASVTRDGHRVFVSLMHSEDLVTDGERLFDWVWNNYTWT